MLITWLSWLLAGFTLLGIAIFATILVLAIMMYRFFSTEKRERALKEAETNAQEALDWQAFKQSVMTQIDAMFREKPKELP
jgi:peptidoglycan/LPS O-acetylase OafA/YrhL